MPETRSPNDMMSAINMSPMALGSLIYFTLIYMKMAERVTNIAAVFRISTLNLSNFVRRNLVRKWLGGQWNIQL